MKLKLITAVMLYFAMTMVLSAQEALTASGGKASGDEGSVSYTIGQLVYSTITGTDHNSITQGVQQPFEISVVSSIEEAIGINLEIVVYPNPATDYLILKINNVTGIKYEASLYSINGMLLKNKKIIDNETQVSMQDLVPGIYFLRVTDNEKEIKVFKIIKK